jgi:hypothetical protein
MAYYDALVAAWNSATQPPAGVSGTALTGLSTANKLIAVNAWTVKGSPTKALLAPSAILNAIAFADLAALTQLQVSQLTLLLAGTSIDASVGTSIRAGIQALFAGKTTTLANLAALVAPFDSGPTLSWCQANGYPNAQNGGGGITPTDLVNAGGLS